MVRRLDAEVEDQFEMGDGVEHRCRNDGMIGCRGTSLLSDGSRLLRGCEVVLPRDT